MYDLWNKVIYKWLTWLVSKVHGSDEAALGLTVSRCVSGSAITPLVFRWKSPMLRVIASRPLTLAWPTLFHVTEPPNLCILHAYRHTETEGTASVSNLKQLTFICCFYFHYICDCTFKTNQWLLKTLSDFWLYTSVSPWLMCLGDVQR